MGSCLLRRWLWDRRGVEAPLLLRLRRPLDDLDLELNEEFDLDPSRLRDLDLRLLLLTCSIGVVQAFFYNTTWAEERGKCLPDPEFFA